MSGRNAKMTRKIMRKQTGRICDEFVKYIKDQRFSERLKFAWRIITAK